MVDNVENPIPYLFTQDLRIKEGDTAFKIANVNVRLSHPIQERIVVNYRLVNINNAGSSVVNFPRKITRTVVFHPGERIQQLQFRIGSNKIDEPNMYFELRPFGFNKKVQISQDSWGSISILDDDLREKPKNSKVKRNSHYLTWVSSTQDHIYISNLNGKNPRKFYEMNSEDLGSDRGIPPFTGFVPTSLTTNNNFLVWPDRNQDRIYRIRKDGRGAKPIVDFLEGKDKNPLNFHAHELTNLKNKLFWVDYEKNKVYRAGINGTGYTELIDSEKLFGQPINGGLTGIAVTGNKIFWSEDGGKSAIYRANLNGRNPVKVLDLNETVGSSTIDTLTAYRGNLYWADKRGIYTSRIDGKDAKKLIDIKDAFGIPRKGTPAKGYDPKSILVHANKIYWSDRLQDTIYRSNINGRNPQKILELNDLFPGFGNDNPNPLGIAIVSGSF